MEYSYPEFAKKWTPVMEAMRNDMSYRWMRKHLRDLRIYHEAGLDPIITSEKNLEEVLGSTTDSIRARVALHVPKEFRETIKFLLKKQGGEEE